LTDLSIDPLLLAGLFFVVALAYSSVGLGGGSSYTALLAIFGAGYLVIPTVTLTMNVVVTTAGGVNYVRRGHARWGLLLPFFASSVPMSYVGGLLPVSPRFFYWALLVTLVIVALRIYVWPVSRERVRLRGTAALVVSLAIGCALGLVAGIVGIGGGIYLVPLIILLGLGTEKEAAACGSLFILVNSIAGLVGRIQQHPVDPVELAPLAGAVLVGGILGSLLGAGPLRPATMKKILGGIVLVAIVLLIRKIVSG